MDLKAAAQAYLEVEETEAGSHPDLDELARYREGGLPGGEHERVLMHLAGCRQCAGTLLDMERFPDIAPADGAPPVSAERAAKGWRELRGRLRAEARLEEGAVRDGRRGWRPWRQLAAAAVLAGVFGLGWQLSSLHRAERPSVNPMLLALMPVEVGERASPLEPRPMPAAAQSVVLLLGGAGLPELPRYAAQIRRDGGEAVFRSDALVLDAEGFVKLTLPRGDLASGRYEVELFGIGGDEALASYRFHLRLEAP